MNYFLTFIRLFWNRYLNFDTLLAIIALVAVHQLVVRNEAVCDFFGRVFAKLELRIKGNYENVTTGSGSIVNDNKIQASWEHYKDNVGVFAIQGRRPYMEDRYNVVTLPDVSTSLYGIFDGHGGEFAAEFIEKSLFKNVMTQLYKSGSKELEDVPGMLRKEILDVDKQLLNIEKFTRDISGTTLLVAMLKNNELVVANVGDSRGVLCDQDGQAVPLSHDHKPQSEKEMKRIKEAGGFVTFNGVWRVGGILAISRALGDFPLKTNDHVIADPDVETFNLNILKPKFMILATDGLWDVFSNEEAVAFISKRLDESHFGAKSLVMQAFYRGSTDNITVMVVKFSYSPEGDVKSEEATVIGDNNEKKIEEFFDAEPLVQGGDDKTNVDSDVTSEEETVDQIMSEF